MPLDLQRIVLFVSDMEKEAAFYRDKLGLPVSEEREGWIEFDAGSCRIALHRGKRKPRLDFASETTLEETCETLRAGGLRLGDINRIRSMTSLLPAARTRRAIPSGFRGQQLPDLIEHRPVQMQREASSRCKCLQIFRNAVMLARSSSSGL